MVDDLFSRPSDLPSSNGLKMADIEGCLVVVKPEKEEVEVTSEYGDTTARPAKVLVVEGPGAGPDWIELYLFGAFVKEQARRALASDKPVLVGVVGKGTAQKGKSAPWEFLDPTDKQIGLARAAYLATSVPF